MITENTARAAGGKTLTVRYYDMINARFRPADDRSGNEIAQDLIARAGLTMG